MKSEEQRIGKPLHPLTLVCLSIVTLNIYWLIWLYRRYVEIQRSNPDATKITPARAALFMLIPVFNIPWLFIVLRDLRCGINKLQADSGDSRGVMNSILIRVGGAGHLLLGGALTSVSLLITIDSSNWFSFLLFQLFGMLLLWVLYLPYQVALNSLWTGRNQSLMRAEGSVLILFIAIGLAIPMSVPASRFLLAIRGAGAEVALRLAPTRPTGDLDERSISRTASLLGKGLDNFGIAADVSLLDPEIDPDDAHLSVSLLLEQANFDGQVDWLLGQFTPHTLALQPVIEGPANQRMEVTDASQEVLPTVGIPTTFYLVRREAVVDGLGVSTARSTTDVYTNGPAVLVQFTQEAGLELADYTQAHIGEALAIVVDGRIVSAPSIQGAISREAMITGGFTIPEAADLAAFIRLARLPLSPTAVRTDRIGTDLWLWRFGAVTLLYLIAGFVLIYGSHRLGRVV